MCKEMCGLMILYLGERIPETRQKERFQKEKADWGIGTDRNRKSKTCLFQKDRKLFLNIILNKNKEVILIQKYKHLHFRRSITANNEYSMFSTVNIKKG